MARYQRKRKMVSGIAFLISCCCFRGGETLKKFQARFPGTMRAEKELLYWNKGQSDTFTEANQATR